jgi:hypothetical protein
MFATLFIFCGREEKCSKPKAWLTQYKKQIEQA